MIASEELAAMKRTAYLINAARGALVDYAALLEALQRGQIAGAAFDTFWSIARFFAASLSVCARSIIAVAHLLSIALYSGSFRSDEPSGIFAP